LMKGIMAPDGYILSHDEIRQMGWDDSCCKTNKTPAKILADNVKRCVEAIRKEDAGKPIYIWSDMFDPFHNAPKTGLNCFVKGDGPFYGSWEGLDKDVIILNWNASAEHRVDALKWFAGRGHRQVLCGYYDQPVANLVPWFTEAKQVKGATGVMYTTWGNDFSALEKFLESTGQAPGTTATPKQ